jgi:lysophospholipase L1-like esterase
MLCVLVAGRQRGREPVVRLLGVLILAILVTSLAACSPGTERGSQGTGEGSPRGTADREMTAAPERAVAPNAPGGETTRAAGVTVSWDYVALGDSLAAGVGARRGYVDRYAAHLRGDTGARVEVVNLGMSGQTSSELLYALRNDASMRRALGGAEVVTFNIGINDLGRAGRAYENGTCGGGDGEGCLRAAVEEVKANWDAVLSELSGLRSTQDTIIRTAGLGYTPRVDEVFEPYLREVNRHIATTAADNGIPHAEVNLGEEGMSPDGVHPNDKGYEVIAERLRELGYDPLSSP